MTTVLAAIDDSPACRPILEVATRAAKLLGAEVVAVHVQHGDSGETARATTRALGIPLLVRDGDTVAGIGAARVELQAVAVAMGSRSLPGGALPVGHVALALTRDASVPVIVVPPDATARPIDRILIALGRNGDGEIVVALAEQLSRIAEPDIVAVHVFRPDEIPPFGDDPTFEAEGWARELLRHTTGTAAARVHLDLRVGDPAIEVARAVRELNADLVVLAWHHDLSDNHARIVRRVLETATVPVVLLDAQPATVA